ncbi:MAG: hypothetical protein PUA92_11180 [Clostridium sp.]|nr:hypothetical protein [Clostridium sp.]
MESFIKIENFGSVTRLYLCGIDISCACSGIEYSCRGGEPVADIITDLNVPRLLECLANATEQQRADAAVIFDSYMQRYKKPDIPA